MDLSGPGDALALLLIGAAVAAAIIVFLIRTAGPRLATILVCGATGVGKSTLINTLAGRPAAQVGIGSPVTQNTVRIEVAEKGFAFYDSRGLEVAEASQTYLLLLSDLLRLRFQRQVKHQVGLVLICIQEPQGRIDDAHLEIAGLCEDIVVPFGIAITKTEDMPELAEAARLAFPAARFVLQVRSLELRIGAVVIPPRGLEELEARLRKEESWSLGAALARSGTAMQTEKLSSAARALAASGGKDGGAWIRFAAAALTLLPLQKPQGDTLLREARDSIRRAYVPNIFARNLLTKFDYPRIDLAVAQRIVPLIVRRFGDGTRRLSAGDCAQLQSEAMTLLDQDRPYRSRF